MDIHPLSKTPTMDYLSCITAVQLAAYHSFDEINDIRTIFWVLRKESGYSFMLGHDKFTHFHFNTGQFWWEKHASPHVLNGRLSSMEIRLTDPIQIFPKIFRLSLSGQLVM